MLIVFKMLQLTELILQLTQASRRACTCRVTSNLQISELFCLQPSTCTGTRYGMLWNKPTCTYSAFDSLRSVPASLNSKIEKGSMSADVQSPSSHPVYHHWQSQDFQSRLPLVTISSLVYQIREFFQCLSLVSLRPRACLKSLVGHLQLTKLPLGWSV